MRNVSEGWRGGWSPLTVGDDLPVMATREADLTEPSRPQRTAALDRGRSCGQEGEHAFPSPWPYRSCFLWFRPRLVS
jgi:hypothetical protein